MAWRIEQWDVRRTPWPVEAGSVQCVMTSPPYWGLRDYGTATWDGGDPECDHRNETNHQKQGTTSQRNGRSNVEDQRNENFRDVCGKCGARRIDSQIGLERTPEEYVATMVEVFREVRRVLRDDGVVWLNLGDCYQSGNRGAAPSDNGRWAGSGLQSKNRGNPRGVATPVNRLAIEGLKPKDLVGIPWRVAFALQADGWWLRSDVVWAKPNPMPESVRDRPTRAHEFVFLLTKSERYFYDQDAIREPHASSTFARLNQRTFDSQTGGPKDYGEGSNRSARRMLENLKRSKTAEDPHAGGRRQAPEPGEPGAFHPNGANARTVWQIATEPFPEAHFATFPKELARRCVLAGSKPGSLVLDPFSGSGTVALVADMHGRDAVGLELNPEYVEMAKRRIEAPRGEGEAERRALEDAGQMSLLDGAE